MIERNCPVCGGGGKQLCLTKGELNLVECTDCAMIFASPVSADYANGSFYEDAGRPFYLSPEKLEGDYSPVRFQRELRLFRRYCASGKVLDVGCSTGAFLFQLRTNYPDDYQTYGTDVSGPALDFAESKGVRTIREDFMAADFPEREFDGMTLWAVLEHVVEPQRFIEQAARVLNPGGICVVLVPNWNSLARRLLKGRYRYILGQHLNYFTPGTLQALAAQHFSIVETTFTHFNPLVIKEDFRAGPERTGMERAKLLQRTNRLKEGGGAILKMSYAILERALGAAQLTDNVAVVLRKAGKTSGGER